MTIPVIRPRSLLSYRSAISAKPTTQVTASAAPCTSRAANSQGSVLAYANSRLAAANASKPATIGPLRPTRSDTAPIGTDTISSVTPNDPNNNPIIVGEAPIGRAHV